MIKLLYNTESLNNLFKNRTGNHAKKKIPELILHISPCVVSPNETYSMC